jgi:hypothetical protein
MRLLAGALAALPLAAAAQVSTSLRPSFGEGVWTMERLADGAPERDRARAIAHPEDLDLQQVFVYPERPGQNQVAWYPFQWQYVDVPPLGGGPGGLRLYYYASEETQARRALPAIESAYARLVEVFHYNPTRRIPFILYATQREFQTQNVFQVTEAVLGVTSPDDLKMTVPYFGDHARFVEVATHEMVHQFQIQKMQDLAGPDASSAIDALPLWFIEGIAEYLSKGGIDVETDLFLRDLLWNPDPARRYQVLPFAEDRLLGYIPTYKLGQARVAFLAEEYGPESIQAFLEQARIGYGPGGPVAERGFPGLVQRVLDEPLEQVDARWRAWLKRRYYAAYLRTGLDLADVSELRGLPAEPEAFTTSPGGEVVLYRGIDRARGRAKLVLIDPRAPETAVEVAADERPGMESLHPIEHSVMALGRDVLVFSAQDGIGDRLYLRRYRHTPGGAPRKAGADGATQDQARARLELGPLRTVDVRPPAGDRFGRFVSIADPALSPDEREVAFVGVAADGQEDVWVAPLDGSAPVRRLTDDAFAKQDLDWGPRGIAYSSDATAHGRPNLFLLDPSTGGRTRLTTHPSTDRHPAFRQDGSLLFTSDAGGKPDVWAWKDGRVRRLTDFTTGLTAPRPVARGQSVLASTFHGGRFRLVEVHHIALRDEPWVQVPPAQGEPLPIPLAELPAAPLPYRPYAARNWRPEAGFVYGGGSAGAIAGRGAILFDDYLRDRLLFADVAVLGSFDYTQALLLFEDRSRRTGLVLGAFHYVQQQLDPLAPDLAYNQRDFGITGALSYPLDRYRRLEAELALGATQRYCLTDFSGDLVLSCSGLRTAGGPYASTADWRRRNGGTNLTVSPAVRFGFDSVRYHPTAGPIDGASLLAELGGGWVPGRSALHGFARADAQRYLHLWGRTRIWARAAVGASFSLGGESRLWERSWWVDPADNLRGYGPGDVAFLLGTHYYVANAELQVPLAPLLPGPLFEYMTGIAGADFGGVFTSWDPRTDAAGGRVDAGAWGSRTLTGVLGANLTLGPILFRVHFGHPFRIGGVETPALAEHHRWVTNVTLRYLFF